MVAPGFYQPVCFNPAFVYLVAGFLIGLSLKFYLDRMRTKTSTKNAPSPRRRRR